MQKHISHIVCAQNKVYFNLQRIQYKYIKLLLRNFYLINFFKFF